MCHIQSWRRIEEDGLVSLVQMMLEHSEIYTYRCPHSLPPLSLPLSPSLPSLLPLPEHGKGKLTVNCRLGPAGELLVVNVIVTAAGKDGSAMDIPRHAM